MFHIQLRPIQMEEIMFNEEQDKRGNQAFFGSLLPMV